MDIDLVTLIAQAALTSWRNPFVAGVAAFIVFAALSWLSRVAPLRGAPLFDSRRAMRLREAAVAQQAQHEARERKLHQHRGRIIFLSAEWERRWWCQKLSVTTDTLQAAVRQVGPMVDDVERYLAAA
jgi:hypothetical protein